MHFETFSNRITNLPPNAILHLFLSGIKPQIKNEVQQHHPTTVTADITLAKLIETKLNDTTQFYNQTITSSQPLLLSLPPITNLTQNSNIHYPIRKLTQTEFQAKKAQGLCYHCDNKFHSGHKCLKKQALLLLLDDEPEPPDPLSSEPAQPEDPTISFHALIGLLYPKSIRLAATVNNEHLSMVADSRSTHNYIQPKVARFLELTIEKT